MPRSYSYTTDEIDAMYAKPDIARAFAHFRNNNFKGEPGAVLTFWSNDYDVATATSFGEKHAKIFRNSINAKRPGTAYLMSDFEGRRGVESLAEYERTHLPKDYQAVSAAASYSYAKSASGTVAVSVRGSKPESFFRCIELDELLKNEKVKNVVIVSQLNEEGTLYSKADAYHELRDEWLQHATKRYLEEKKKIDDPRHMASLSPDERETIKSEYADRVKDLAYEIVLAERTREKTLPFSVFDPLQAKKDRERENKRIADGASLIADNRTLRDAVEVERTEIRKTYIEALIEKDKAVEAAAARVRPVGTVASVLEVARIESAESEVFRVVKSKDVEANARRRAAPIEAHRAEVEARAHAATHTRDVVAALTVSSSVIAAPAAGRLTPINRTNNIVPGGRVRGI